MQSAAAYAARVDAVLAQRDRLRGPQPPGDLFGGLPPDHALMASDARRLLEPNLAIIASYVEPDDVIIDVGGGAGRLSLPLALRCREVINIDPSAAMGAGFEANARRAGITNVHFVQGGWPLPDPPGGDLVLVNHVTYLTRDIVPFIHALEATARRRVLITINSPPPPAMHRQLYQLVYGEDETVVPGHAELANVLWELGILPDVRVLPQSTIAPPPPAISRDAALETAVARFSTEQWALWPPTPELHARVRGVLEEHFDTLFAEPDSGFDPRWIRHGHKILISW